MLPSFFVAKVLSKKLLLSLLGSSGAGSLLFYGVLKPRKNNKSLVVLDGSRPLLDKKKGDPNAWDSSRFFVKDFSSFQKNPDVYPYLTAAHLHQDTYKQYEDTIWDGPFKKQIPQIFKKVPIDQPALRDKWYVNERGKETEKDMATTLVSATRLRRAADDYCLVSEKEIPWKSYLFNWLLSKYEKEHVIQDILWSMAEEGEANKLSFRPHSINIDFKLTHQTITNRKDYFPIPASIIEDLEIEFLVFNSNSTVQKIFKSINIAPYRELGIKIRLKKGELRPYAVNKGIQLVKYATWGIEPVQENEYEIAVTEIFPDKEYSYFTTPRLGLLYGRSKFFSEVITSYVELNSICGIATANIPTYSDYEKVVETPLANITSQQVKKDIEYWYGYYSAHYLALMIDDFSKLLNLGSSKVVASSNGPMTTIIDNFAKNQLWRNGVYDHLRLNKDYRKVVDNLFDFTNAGDSKRITPKAFTAWTKSLSYQLGILSKNTKITFQWEKEPEITISSDDENSPYPTLAFKFKQTIHFTDKVIIPFKGYWDETKQEYSESKPSSGTSEEFDLSEKVNNLQTFLQPIQSILSRNVAGINLWSSLIPDTQKYIGWDKIEIAKDEKIVNTIEAQNTPIRPALGGKYDSQDQYYSLAGWKALDVKFSQSLKDFHQVFAKLYSKIKSKDPTKPELSISYSTLTNISGFKTQAKGSPITAIIDIINQIFETSGDQKDQNNEDKNPWLKFFKTLLEQEYLVSSTQMFVGFPDVFYSVAKKDSTTTTEHKIEDIIKKANKDEEGNIKKIEDKSKIPELRRILENYVAHYSSNFPRSPIIYKQTHHLGEGAQGESVNPKWTYFLNNEGASTVGFIRHQQRIKEIFQDTWTDSYLTSNNYTQKVARLNHFPEKQFVNWDRVKVSVTPLNLEKAFRSVLNMKISSNIRTLLRGASLLVGNVVISNILGNAIARDFMYVTINLMLADGSLSYYEKPITFAMNSVYSIYRFGVNINIDKCKIGLEKSLKSKVNIHC